MDLESLKKRNAANVKPVQVADLSLHLRKLTAADGMAVGKAFQAAGHTDPNGPEPSAEQFVIAFALLLSKTVCDEAGTLTLDSDEGRAEIAKLDFRTLQELATAAQQWSGLIGDDSKKN
jgi:hypothetical protein